MITDEGRHNDLEIDGFRYIRSYKHECSKESNPVIDTWERFHIITSVFEEKSDYSTFVLLPKNSFFANSVCSIGCFMISVIAHSRITRFFFVCRVWIS